MASTPRGTSTEQLRLAEPRIQVLPDLHLEFGQQYSSYSFPATAPYLLLGGGVGRLIDYDEYLGFMEGQARRFEKVFLVLGNHEFYGLEYEAGLHMARCLMCLRLLSLARLFYYTEPGGTIPSPTLRCWVARCGLLFHSRLIMFVQSKVKVFKNIGGWSAEKHNKLHREEHLWLREQVAQIPSDRQMLVVTHHAPRVEGTLRPQHVGNPWTCAFATDVMDQAWDGVRVWVFGHTHCSTEVVLESGIRLLGNQRGYVVRGSEGRSGDVYVFDDGLAIWTSWEVEMTNDSHERWCWFWVEVSHEVDLRMGYRGCEVEIRR
ncbi:hypothetical protein ACHAPT_012959 [Fusarium lateritium]